MKELNPSSWLYWFGLFTLTCMLLPVMVVLVRRKFGPGFIALAIYFLSTFLYNLLLVVFPDFPKDIRRSIGISSNVLDAPLMLLFLLQFTADERMKKLIKICFFAFLFFEFGIILFYGFTVKSITIFSGPGLLLILCFSFFFFTHYVRITITQRLDIAKTMMISGILFAYGIYFMVYLFYYIMETPNKVDSLIIYFLASIVASLLLSSGMLREKKATGKKIADPGAKYGLPKQPLIL
jgi:hypothetical protein